MSHRFLMPLAVVGSAGLVAAFMPTIAAAATHGHSAAAHSTAATSQSSATGAVSLTGRRTLRAPASVSHHLHEAPRAGSAATDPNPDLMVQFYSADVGALGATFQATVTGYDTPTTGGLSATLDWGDGTSTNYSDISTSPSFSHEYSSTGVYTITLTVSDGAGDGSTTTWSGLATEGSEFTPYPPTRLLDTRKDLGASGPVGPKGTVKLQVGNPPIPEPDGISAVVLNVTVTEGTANGFLTVFGDNDSGGSPSALPQTSNLNFRTDQNVANLVIVPVGSNGLVDFYNGSKGGVQVIADVEGYFSLTETSKFVNVGPVRILNTRNGTGTGAVKQIPANGDLTLTVAGAGKGAIPTSGASAIAMNLTAVDSTRNGVITAYPAGESLPTVSNLNYSAGQTVANAAIVPVGTNGQIVFHNSSTGPVNLIADATGYFTADQVAGGNVYVPFGEPQRIYDSRPGTLPTGVPFPLSNPGLTGATSLVLNATVTEPTGNGYLALYPYDPNTPSAVPATSNLNYLTGQTIPNLAIAPIGTVPDDSFQPPLYEYGVYLGGHGSAQVFLDIFGYFANS